MLFWINERLVLNYNESSYNIYFNLSLDTSNPEQYITNSIPIVT